MATPYEVEFSELNYFPFFFECGLNPTDLEGTFGVDAIERLGNALKKGLAVTEEQYAIIIENEAVYQMEVWFSFMKERLAQRDLNGVATIAQEITNYMYGSRYSYGSNYPPIERVVNVYEKLLSWAIENPEGWFVVTR